MRCVNFSLSQAITARRVKKLHLLTHASQGTTAQRAVTRWSTAPRELTRTRLRKEPAKRAPQVKEFEPECICYFVSFSRRFIHWNSRLLEITLLNLFSALDGNIVLLACCVFKYKILRMRELTHYFMSNVNKYLDRPFIHNSFSCGVQCL